MGIVLTVIAVVVVLVVLIAGVLGLSLVSLYVQLQASGVPVTITRLLGTKLRQLDPKYVAENLIALHKAGIPADIDQLETHILAGGHLADVTSAAISAHKAGMDFSFARLAAIDLAGRGVLEAVNASVNPKVLVCPAKSSERIMGVARDGVRLSARVRVTVRANLDRLVGGAGEQTILARVGEGIVGAIGRAASHKEILERPEAIAAYILDRGLDSGTGFSIVSVDVADVDVVDNVGARLAEEQAGADTKVAQARAEMRRAMAVASEYENKAATLGMTANVIAARSTIPLALAGACRSGRVWRLPRPVLAGPQPHLWDASSNV